MDHRLGFVGLALVAVGCASAPPPSAGSTSPQSPSTATSPATPVPTAAPAAPPAPAPAPDSAPAPPVVPPRSVARFSATLDGKHWAGADATYDAILMDAPPFGAESELARTAYINVSAPDGTSLTVHFDVKQPQLGKSVYRCNANSCANSFSIQYRSKTPPGHWVEAEPSAMEITAFERTFNGPIANLRVDGTLKLVGAKNVKPRTVSLRLENIAINDVGRFAGLTSSSPQPIQWIP